MCSQTGEVHVVSLSVRPRAWLRVATAFVATLLLHVSAVIGSPAHAEALPLYVVNQGFLNGVQHPVGAFDTSGAVVNPALISGLHAPTGIAVSGSNLFVVNSISPTGAAIGEYTTSGDTVNAALISESELGVLAGIAVSGSNLFVVNSSTGTVGEYTTSGATVNTALISGLNNPFDIAVSGSNLFVTNHNAGTVGEYTTSGDTVNTELLTGLAQPYGIAVSGSHLFVGSSALNTVGEYTTSGDTVNASLIIGWTTQPALP